MAKEGNCYAVTEAAWHILGGQDSEWEVMRLKIPGEKHSHWFLRHGMLHGIVIDLSVRQFKTPPDYRKGIHCAFLTTEPSKKAQILIEQMTWQKK